MSNARVQIRSLDMTQHSSDSAFLTSSYILCLHRLQDIHGYPNHRHETRAILSQQFPLVVSIPHSQSPGGRSRPININKS